MTQFKEGNQFWRMRKKHGRKRLFETPEAMWEAACEYFQWCVDNPLYEKNIVKYRESYEIVDLPKMRPFTIQGLCHFIGCNGAYFNQFEKNLNVEKIEIDRDFSNIVIRIRETIYRQKYEGAASGLLNPSIIARDLSLSEKVEHSVTEVDFSS